MGKFLAQNPDIMAATDGMELANEPALYNILKGTLSSHPVYGQKGYFEHLFIDHMMPAVREIRRWWDGYIYFPAFRYNGSFRDLLVRRDGVSALSRIRTAIGPQQLVWSLHSYPTWNNPLTSPSKVRGTLEAATASIGADPLCVTETNLAGTSLVDHPPENAGIATFVAAMQDFRRAGYGTGYFPVCNTGASALLQFAADGTVSTVHPYALAEIFRLWCARGEVAPTPSGGIVSNISITADTRDPAGLVRGAVIAGQLRLVVLAANGAADGAANMFSVIIGHPMGGHVIKGHASAARSYIGLISGQNTVQCQSTGLDIVRCGDGDDTVICNGAKAFIDCSRGFAKVTVNGGASHIYTNGAKSLVAYHRAGAEHHVYDQKAQDSFDVSAWGAGTTVTQSAANVEVANGANRLIFWNRTVAAVRPCLVGLA